MKYLRPIPVLVAFTLITGCSSANKKPPSAETKTTAVADLGKLHHPVLTENADAQHAFDQGLSLVYAFNHDEAIRSFKKASELDPQLAMAHWGVALALGPNYNVDVDPDREKQAFAEIQKATELVKAPAASDPERAYIYALSKRYSNDAKPDFAKLAQNYANAMRELAKRYPDDMDAATLFADSMMVLHPWHFYSADGKAQSGTDELVTELERVLKREPDHIGANHLYIHAVEASTHPERALESAGRLAGLAPGAGHLVHMPAHIYIRTGDYDAAAGSNRVAAEVDRGYIKARGEDGIYPMMYYSHNLHFLAVAEGMQGRFGEAKRAADLLAAHVGPHLPHMPMLEGFMPTPTLVLTRFHRWDDILKTPEPDRSLAVTRTVWHFARGMAFASANKLPEAQIEREALADGAKALPADAMYSPLNKASDVFKVAMAMLDAKIWEAKGDRKASIELLKKAVEAEDALSYMEPPDWYLPSREAMGGVCLRNGDFAQAEKVFRAELDKNVRSGRSLFGLMESLKGQNKTYEAGLVKPQFDAAWKNAEAPLTVNDL